MLARKLWISLVALLAINAIHVYGQNFGDFIPLFMDMIGGFVPRSQLPRVPLQSQRDLVTRQSGVNGFNQGEFGHDSPPNFPGIDQGGSQTVPEMFASRRSPRHHSPDEINGSRLGSFPRLDGSRSGGPSFGQRTPGGAGNPGRHEQLESFGGIIGEGGRRRLERPGRPGNGPDVVVPSGNGQNPGANIGPDTAEQARVEPENLGNDQADMMVNSQVVPQV